MEKHLIISRYTESLEWLDEIDFFDKVFVYNKGPKINNQNEIKLPNVGREAHTFCYHIARNYNQLGDINIFVQGNPFDHIKKISNFGSLSLFFRHHNYSLEKSEPLLTDLMVDVPRYTALCYEDCLLGNAPDPILFSPGAQWIVPKNIIISKTQKFYIKILRNLSQKERINNTDGVYNAWNLEGMWNYIFNPLTKEKEI